MKAGRILVVDDNPSNLKLVEFLLASEKHEVRSAVDAASAMRTLEHFDPDLILMDLQLPDVDGLELTRRLKAAGPTAHIPIVAVTAYAMKGDEQRAREAGVDGYVSKPIDRVLFRRVVAEFIERTSASSSKH